MKYLTVTSPNIENGLGCRVTLWVAGCSHHCKNCHNQHTWDYNQGKPLFESLTEIRKHLSKPYISGLTLSGGDPLSQTDDSLYELLEFLKTIKNEFPDKNIWIYAGEYYEDAIKHDIKRQILELCDYMVDGPYEYTKRDVTLPFRGSSNQHIIDLKNKR